MSTQLFCYWGFSKRQWGTSVGHTSGSNETSGSWLSKPWQSSLWLWTNPWSNRSHPGQYPAVQMGVWRSSQTIKTNLSHLCYLPSIESLPAPSSACQALMAKSLGMDCSNKTYWDGLELNFCASFVCEELARCLSKRSLRSLIRLGNSVRSCPYLYLQRPFNVMRSRAKNDNPACLDTSGSTWKSWNAFWSCRNWFTSPESWYFYCELAWSEILILIRWYLCPNWPFCSCY